MKEFNIIGTCIPKKHYMVDISKKLNEIEALIDKGKYFNINRPRQYGKTTTLSALYRRLKDKYYVVRLSFEGMSEESFADNSTFVSVFQYKFADEMEFLGIDALLVREWLDTTELQLRSDVFDFLSRKITWLCKKLDKEILLMIDESDNRVNSQVFINFLGMLRNKYLAQEEERDITFKSVILSGLYDIKNIKVQGKDEEECNFSSPWNIAVDFRVHMRFAVDEIATMLREYEQDHHTGMDVRNMSRWLYFYTSGYPVLVSRMCKWIDEEGGRVWTRENLRNAWKSMLLVHNVLFDDMIKVVDGNEELKELVTQILFNGYTQAFSMADPVVNLGFLYGILNQKNNRVEIANVIFESYLYEYLVSVRSRQSQLQNSHYTQLSHGGEFDATLILDQFQELVETEYSKMDPRQYENEGFLLLLSYLYPIIHNSDMYYIEPETRSRNRLDIVIMYQGVEYVLGLIKCNNAQEHEEGVDQLEAYMDGRCNNNGYLVTFWLGEDKRYEAGYLPEEMTWKTIYEIVV